MPGGDTVRFGVRVKPKARAERVGGTWADGSLVVEVQAATVDGKANAAVVAPWPTPSTSPGRQ